MNLKHHFSRKIKIHRGLLNKLQKLVILLLCVQSFLLQSVYKPPFSHVLIDLPAILCLLSLEYRRVLVQFEHRGQFVFGLVKLSY